MQMGDIGCQMDAIEMHQIEAVPGYQRIDGRGHPGGSVVFDRQRPPSEESTNKASGAVTGWRRNRDDLFAERQIRPRGKGLTGFGEENVSDVGPPAQRAGQVILAKLCAAQHGPALARGDEEDVHAVPHRERFENSPET